MKEMRPIDYAVSACETMMRKFHAPELPPKGHFHYHQGVFLSGMYQTHLLTGNSAYFTYMKDWVDSVIDAQGRILNYNHGVLDDIQPGILLYPLLDQTGDERYLKGLRSVYAQVPDVKRTAQGGFWHNPSLENQMWLDGLYMAGPFCAEYAQRFGDSSLRELVIHQALLMEEKTRDPQTGLLYHAWDGSQKTEWANPQTGCAPEFWGRSMGWVPVAIWDELDHIDPGTAGWTKIRDVAKRLLEALCRFQSEDGRWYQVVNKGGQPGNWLENSCSCLYVAALCKGVRMGYLDPQYAQNAYRGYEGVVRSLTWDNADLLIGNVCIGTGVGGYEFYCKRPVSVNDLHGVGAFLLMCTQVQRLLDAGIPGAK